MKLIIKRQPFLKAFARAAAVAPSRSNKPILQNVLLTAGSESAIEATDLEVAVRVSLGPEEMDVDAGGKVLLPSALFHAILRESNDECLLLSLDGKGNLSVKGERTQHRLQTEKPDEFPTIENRELGDAVVLPAALIARGLSATGSLVTENSRYALHCILLDFSGDSVAFVGSNGSALGVLETKCKAPKAVESLVPHKAARLLARLFADASGDVMIWTLDNWLRFRVGSVTAMARLGEGRFPRWRDVIGCFNYPTNITAPAGALRSAIRQISLTVSSDESSVAAIVLRDGTLGFSAESASVGKSEAEIPVTYDGKEFNTSANWRYLAACLQSFSDADDITIKFKEPSDAIFIEHGELRFVVMPCSMER